MKVRPMTSLARGYDSRRWLYRRSGRVLLGLLAGCTGPRVPDTWYNDHCPHRSFGWLARRRGRGVRFEPRSRWPVAGIRGASAL